jgi:hypothetical protein
MINVQKLIEGLKNKTIKVLQKGHLTHDLIEDLERRVRHWQGVVEKEKAILASGKSKTEHGSDRKSMIERFEKFVTEPLEPGRYIEMGGAIEAYCFNCDATMYVFLVDENTVAYCDSHDYWDIAEKSGQKYGYAFKKTDVLPCPAMKLVKQKKMVTTIDVPTGELIFRNHFGEEIDDAPEDEKYSKPGLNSLLGRDKIMQYLGKQGFGYGQMGNMSVGIFSNGKNEIIVGDSYAEDRLSDHEHCLKKGLYSAKEMKQAEAEINELRAFKKMLKDGKFKKLGSISLAVWRWMCADKAILQKSKFPMKELKDEYSDVVEAKVLPGKWKVEHYFDFQRRQRGEDPVYSRLTLEA